MGKTTVLQQLSRELGATFVTLENMLAIFRSQPASGWDLALLEYLSNSLRSASVLIIDGYQKFQAGRYFPRNIFANHHIINLLYRYAEQEGRTIILSGNVPTNGAPVSTVFFKPDVPVVHVPPLNRDDYASLARHVMGNEMADKVDFDQVYRLASMLSGHELRVACQIAASRDELSTRAFLDIISIYIASANTRTEEVEAISFEQMPGMEAIAEALETQVVLPLTDPELAERFDLRAKRGVLLHGPPGTGKTSVGRALAHRLKGRFFLIDGSIPSEPAYAFLGRVQAIAQEAIENAPSVIFIDDADVLFGVGHIAGLTRYLLTLLDGLQGRNASKVCVMMTAMDPKKVPEAVLRSGRVELWLETCLPKPSVRADILKRWMGDKLPHSDAIDYARLAGETEGFNAADLRRVTADARAFYAADLALRRHASSATEYVSRAIGAVIETRTAMAINLADPSLRVR